jgi:hypothetical protein
MPDPRRPGDPTPAHAPATGHAATAAAAPTQPVVVQGTPLAAAAPDAPDPDAPKLDEAPDGGRFLRNARYDAKERKHYGGQVVDSNGVVLNEFDDKEENTGQPKEPKEKK